MRSTRLEVIKHLTDVLAPVCSLSFHASVLPQLWSFPLPPSSRPSKLLLAAILATATVLHPSPQISALHPQAMHLLDLALSDLVLAPLRSSRTSSSDPSAEGELDDIVGLCIAVTWLVGLEGSESSSSTRKGDVLMSLAWRLATDRCRRGGQIGEEPRKRVWELVQVSCNHPRTLPVRLF